MSIIDFLADAFNLHKSSTVRMALCCILFVPTLIFSQVIPGVFFKALELAGGIAAMVIFGIMPALMRWNIRYRNELARDCRQVLVTGGKPVLVMVIALALGLIGYEIVKNIFQ